MSLPMTFELGVKLAIAFVVVIIMMLCGALLFAYSFSALAIVTALFFLSYPLAWFGWKSWHTLYQSWLHPILYAQAKRAGESGLLLRSQTNKTLQRALLKEIDLLASHNDEPARANAVDTAFLHIFDGLPLAIWVFDEGKTLIYLNSSAKQTEVVPALMGRQLTDIGFNQSGSVITHHALQRDWQVQSSELSVYGKTFTAIFASNISSYLLRNEQIVQSNLVRVLSHEMRNSLTPIESLSDTLLSQERWDESQVRQILARINQRAGGLLNFVQRFAAVAKLPDLHCRWVRLEEITEQAQLLLNSPHELCITGESRCYADPELMAQVLMNLVKNALESVESSRAARIEVACYIRGDLQHIVIKDNGSGFANIQNASTPLYTTKSNGMGIGLALVGAIVNKHGGKLSLSNRTDGRGALVQLSWPLGC